MEIFNLLGKVCKRCGFSDWRALQIDHINGGGSKEFKKQGGETYYYRILKELKEGSPRFQILCANCNFIKRHEEKEWPNLQKEVI